MQAAVALQKCFSFRADFLYPCNKPPFSSNLCAMLIVTSILRFAGSLGFLLYGMKLMSSGVQKSAGAKLQHALRLVTGNRFVALLTGMVITMVIQSSGATTAMTVSFVNAGLLSLTNAVGVIFGANIGTTITAWIVSLSSFNFNFDISAFAVPLFGAGFFLSLLKKTHVKNAGEAVMGFGLLFLGLAGLKDTFSFNAEQLDFLTGIQNMGALSILIGFLLGIIITALMHSSSAFTAVVITLAFNRVVTWETAAALTLGSDIGSTIDAVLASIGSSTNARRTAIIHVLFNVFGTALALLLFRPLLSFVSLITFGANIAIRIAALHTVFKTLTTLILLPLVGQLVRLSMLIIKEKKSDSPKYYHLEFVEGGKENAAMHIVRVEKELSDMSKVIEQMFVRLFEGFKKRTPHFIENNIEGLERAENYCDQMHEQLVRYIIKCERLPISENQRQNLLSKVQIIEDLEQISDECLCAGLLLQRSIEKKMKFHPEDMERLSSYFQTAYEFLVFINISINHSLNKDEFQLARDLEHNINATRRNLKKLARKRIESGADVKAELLYLDLVRQIEKLGDHLLSISEQLAQTV